MRPEGYQGMEIKGVKKKIEKEKVLPPTYRAKISTMRVPGQGYRLMNSLLSSLNINPMFMPGMNP
jgi:hypothetical protein